MSHRFVTLSVALRQHLTFFVCLFSFQKSETTFTSPQWRTQGGSSLPCDRNKAELMRHSFQSSTRSLLFIPWGIWIQIQLFWIRLWSALLWSSLGQSILFHFACPLIEPILLVCYGFLRGILGPWCQGYIPKRLLMFLKNYYFPTKCYMLFEVPLIAVALQEFFAAMLLALTKHDIQQHTDIQHFLVLSPTLAIRLGSGSFYQPDNCFFSTALARGPTTQPSLPPVAMSSIRNLQLSQTLLYMCILSYHPHLFRPCLQAGMFPGTSYYTAVSSPQSGSSVHIICHATWAVVILQQTSDLLWLSLEDAAAGKDFLVALPWVTSSKRLTIRAKKRQATVRKSYYAAMLRAGNRLIEYDAMYGDNSHPLRAASVALSKNVSKGHRSHITDHPPPRITVFQFLEYLVSQNIKLYATGHSVGGALASLLAFHLKHSRSVKVSAVASFGAPPIGGNQAFCDDYNASVDVSWRFETGNELGTLFPPLPWLGSSQLLRFVGERIDVQKLLDDQPSSRSTPSHDEQRTVDYLDELAETEQLPSLFLDHNPFVTLRYLQSVVAALEGRKRRDAQWMTKDLDATITPDSENDVFYSAHQGSLLQDY
jgi:hypothetical protein